jgi:TRAP-type C4-dicarboxylate transport system substrate-binding protein
MFLTRRAISRGLLATPALLTSGRARAATTLKISHQFPGGTIEQGDCRDRMVRRFAAEVTKRTNGELAFEIYPGSSLTTTPWVRRRMSRSARILRKLHVMPSRLLRFTKASRWR